MAEEVATVKKKSKMPGFLKRIFRFKRHKKDKKSSDHDNSIQLTEPPAQARDATGSLAPVLEGTCLDTLVTVRHGDSHTFTIHVSGCPKPTVLWYLGDEEIRTTNNMRLKVSGNEHSLMIPEMTQDVSDKGISVIAINKAGEARRNVLLSVYKILSHRNIPTRYNSESFRSPDARLLRRRTKLRAPVASMASLDSFASQTSGTSKSPYHETHLDDVFYDNQRSATLPSPSKRAARPHTYHPQNFDEKSKTYTTSDLLGLIYSPKRVTENSVDDVAANRPMSLALSQDVLLVQGPRSPMMRHRSDAGDMKFTNYPDQYNSLPDRHLRSPRKKKKVPTATLR